MFKDFITGKLILRLLGLVPDKWKRIVAGVLSILAGVGACAASLAGWLHDPPPTVETFLAAFSAGLGMISIGYAAIVGALAHEKNAAMIEVAGYMAAEAAMRANKAEEATKPAATLP